LIKPVVLLSFNKPFLASLGRSTIENYAIYPNIDKVLRVYTDGVVFTSDNIICKNGFLKESKTTGLINWVNSQEYNIVSS